MICECVSARSRAVEVPDRELRFLSPRSGLRCCPSSSRRFASPGGWLAKRSPGPATWTGCTSTTRSRRCSMLPEPEPGACSRAPAGTTAAVSSVCAEGFADGRVGPGLDGARGPRGSMFSSSQTDSVATAPAAGKRSSTVAVRDRHAVEQLLHGGAVQLGDGSVAPRSAARRGGRGPPGRSPGAGRGSRPVDDERGRVEHPTGPAARGCSGPPPWRGRPHRAPGRRQAGRVAARRGSSRSRAAPARRPPAAPGRPAAGAGLPGRLRWFRTRRPTATLTTPCTRARDALSVERSWR